MKFRGFTLIELMIVVAVIGVLAMTAIPIFNRYVNDAAHAESTSILADIASKEEAYFIRWNTFVSASEGYDTANPPMGVRMVQKGHTPNNAWAQLGFNRDNNNASSGGIFGAPVYYMYAVAANANDYIVCGIRRQASVTGTQPEIATLTRRNRRAPVYLEGDSVSLNCTINP